MLSLLLDTSPQRIKWALEAVAKRRFEVVSRIVRERITNGDLMPGDKLPAERELAVELGVARPVIREALRSLEEAGVLELRRGTTGGAFVRSGHPEPLMRSVSDLVAVKAVSFEDLMEARLGVLQFIIALAVERGTDADFDRLEEHIDALSEARVAAKLRSFSVDAMTMVGEFYDLLGHAARNEMLVYLMHSMSELVVQFLHETRTGVIETVIASRRRLMVHLRARDKNAATREVTEHLIELHREVIARAQKVHNEAQTRPSLARAPKSKSISR